MNIEKQVEERPGDFARGLRRGIGFATGLVLCGVVLLTGALLAGELFRFSAGDLISSSAINHNFDTLQSEMAPVGSIVAWHRDFGGGTPIPAGWLECDGSDINDSESPYDGLTLPNLNGGGRFLRGGSASGTLQDHAFQEHGHSISPNPHGHTIRRGIADNILAGAGGIPNAGSFATPRDPDPDQSANNTSLVIGNATDTGSGLSTATETRPTNMSVIWIMRVK